jgi:SAM-dependent methyltransferase
MSQISNIQQAAVWDGALGEQWAAHEERYDALLSGCNHALLDAAAIGERDLVLDVGCGTGQTTRLAAQSARLGHATGIDLSAAMLQRAHAAAEKEQVTNATFLQGDAEIYPFPAESFDAAISRGGVMFFANPVAAFQNISHALRAGGRLAFIAPRVPQPGSEASRVLAPLATVPVSGELDAEMDRAMFSLADPDDILALLHAAGFLNASVDPVDAPVHWGRDAADAADFALGMTRTRARLAQLDASTRERIRIDVMHGFAAHESPDGVHLPGAVWLAHATRP